MKQYYKLDPNYKGNMKFILVPRYTGKSLCYLLKLHKEFEENEAIRKLFEQYFEDAYDKVIESLMKGE